jgi:hypothetical protein
LVVSHFFPSPTNSPPSLHSNVWRLLSVIAFTFVARIKPLVKAIRLTADDPFSTPLLPPELVDDAALPHSTSHLLGRVKPASISQFRPHNRYHNPPNPPGIAARSGFSLIGVFSTLQRRYIMVGARGKK